MRVYSVYDKTAVDFVSLEEVKKCLAFRELPLSDWRNVKVLDKDGNKIIWAININGEIFNDEYAKYDVCYILKSPLKNELNLSFTEKTINEPNQEPETKTEEVEITEDDIKWIGDNIFHIVFSELINSKGNSENITFNYIKDEIIKKSWDRKSQFILSGSRVYPLDAVEKYLAKDGRTVQDVFDLWKQIAIEDYNQ